MILTYGNEAEKLFEKLCEEWDSFYEQAVDELDVTTIDAKTRVPDLLEQMSYAEEWTYFWEGECGSQYLFFPCAEDELLIRLRELEQIQRNSPEESEE